jgi:hypothetical protein
MSPTHTKKTKPVLRSDYDVNWDIDVNYVSLERDKSIDKLFQDLANNINTTDWRSSDWYRAGYEEGKNSK